MVLLRLSEDEMKTHKDATFRSAGDMRGSSALVDVFECDTCCLRSRDKKFLMEHEHNCKRQEVNEYYEEEFDRGIL